MAAPDCDEGVTVHLGDVDGAGEDVRCVLPGVDKAKEGRGYPHWGRISALILVSYYFLFMFYLVSFSKNWWHAALGIAVATVFLIMSSGLSGLCC